MVKKVLVHHLVLHLHRGEVSTEKESSELFKGIIRRKSSILFKGSEGFKTPLRTININPLHYYSKLTNNCKSILNQFLLLSTSYVSFTYYLVLSSNFVDTYSKFVDISRELVEIGEFR